MYTHKWKEILVDGQGDHVGVAFLLGSWRTVFYLVAGLFVIPFVGVFVLAKSPEPVTDRVVDKRVDWVGAFLYTAGFILLFLSLSQSVAETKGWSTPCKQSGVASDVGVIEDPS